jgi:hypothetical protein
MKPLSKILISQFNQIVKETTGSKTGETLKNNRLPNSNPKCKRGY